jgi:hypothetical protein
MEDILTTVLENSITLSVMFFAWSLAERRAKNERDRVKEVSQNFIEYLKQADK